MSLAAQPGGKATAQPGLTSGRANRGWRKSGPAGGGAAQPGAERPSQGRRGRPSRDAGGRRGTGPEAQPGQKQERGAGGLRMRPTPGETLGSGPAGIKNWLAQPGAAVPAWADLPRPSLEEIRPGLNIPAQGSYNPARALITRPNLAVKCFSISCAHNTTYIMYISHNKGVLWYTRGYIPDISPRGCGGLVESRTGFNKKYTKVPNSYAS
jgi:hypothetical protein